MAITHGSINLFEDLIFHEYSIMARGKMIKGRYTDVYLVTIMQPPIYTNYTDNSLFRKLLVLDAIIFLDLSSIQDRIFVNYL